MKNSTEKITSTNKTTSDAQQTYHSRAMQTSQNEDQLTLGEKSVHVGIDQLVHFCQSNDLATKHNEESKHTNNNKQNSKERNNQQEDFEEVSNHDMT